MRQYASSNRGDSQLQISDKSPASVLASSLISAPFAKTWGPQKEGWDWGMAPSLLPGPWLWGANQYVETNLR